MRSNLFGNFFSKKLFTIFYEFDNILKQSWIIDIEAIFISKHRVNDFTTLV